MPDELHPVSRLFAHTQATDPDRFVVATVPRAARSVERDRRVRLGRGARTAVVPVDAVRPARVAGGRPRARLLDRLLPADGTLGPRDRTDSAQPISNALYAALRHRAAHAAAQPDRAAAAAGGVRELPSGVTAIPFDEIAAGPGRGRDGRRPDGIAARPPAAGRRHRRASTASCSASPTRPTTASSAANRGGAGCTAARTGRRSATATPARPAGSGRSPSATRRCSARSSGTSPPRSCPAASFAIWIGGHADGRSCRRSGRASGSSSSRSSCAGTARSRTSRATCRSRRVSSDRTTPRWSGAAGTIRSVCRKVCRTWAGW